MFNLGEIGPSLDTPFPRIQVPQKVILQPLHIHNCINANNDGHCMHDVRTIRSFKLVSTLSLKSFIERYGSLNGFLWCFPSSNELTLRQSKKWSNISANFALSSASGPPFSFKAVLTRVLSTWKFTYYVRWLYVHDNSLIPELRCQIYTHL